MAGPPGKRRSGALGGQREGQTTWLQCDLTNHNGGMSYFLFIILEAIWKPSFAPPPDDQCESHSSSWFKGCGARC